MPRTITLRATSKHPTKDEGETYESLANEAMVDLYRGYARGYKPPKFEREIIHVPPEKKIRRKYKRRDLQAE
jgi:hypothetical protein